VLGQAAGFAVLAAVSPTALLVMAVFLGSANPRTTALLYVAGAMIMTVAMAVAVLLILRATGLNQPHQHDPRYGLRLGLGFLALIAAVIVARRSRRPALAMGTPAMSSQAAEARTAGAPAAGTRQKPTGLVSRLVAEPKPSTAFGVGVLLFAPSATFIAAVQVVATARASTAATALALVIVILLSALTVWLPLLAYLAAPGPTTRLLKSLNGWLRANGRFLLMLALVIGGLWLVVNGSAGLAGT
jgi:Sap, sulfolipid-1-addressing protein